MWGEGIFMDLYDLRVFRLWTIWVETLPQYFYNSDHWNQTHHSMSLELSS